MTAIAVTLAFIVGAAAGWLIVRARARATHAELGSTIESAVKRAEEEGERKIKAAELEARAHMLDAEGAAKVNAEKRDAELESLKKTVRAREAMVDERARALAQRETELSVREVAIAASEKDTSERLAKADARVTDALRELERVASMSQHEAKAALIASVENEAKAQAAVKLRELDKELRKDGDARAAKVLAEIIQRQASGFVAEKTVSVVELPNDEMKGRIIGREGRNIRAIEAATGVDVIIDDTPEAVIVSGFNPLRREIAKVALDRLVADGRIHPARIEEVVAQVEDDMDNALVKAGEDALAELGVTAVHPELVRLLGRLKHHVVGGQNVLTHCIETGLIAGTLAAELGVSQPQAKRAGLFHDIGKAVGHEHEGHHADVGADIAARYGERPEIVEAIRTHHDPDPPSVTGALVYTANILSKQRPGARRDQIDGYVKRLDDLERTALSFAGVERAYIVQAGREVRVLVDFTKVDDAKALVLSQDIARKIQDELTYPGEVRVTVVREARATEIAR